MKPHKLLFVVGLCTLVVLLAHPIGAQQTALTTILTNATVIDGTGAPPRADSTVVIRGNRIVEIRAGRYQGPEGDGVRVFDLEGGYILPGLWNNHSHLSDLLPDPHNILVGEPVVAIEIDGPFQMRRAVRENIKNGADFIKIMVDEIGRLEIEQLVFSGISEMNALIAATRNAADMVGMLDQVGTVEEGKIADLIVLGGNPLDHISNIRKLKMVFKDGLPVNLARDEGQTSFWELYFR